MDLNAGLKMTDSSALQPRKRPRSPSCSSDEEELEPTPPLYPPEIWEAIFHYLTGLQLLRMRLVCRRWRDIITGCPPLMAQFKIVLENFELYDEEWERISNDESIDHNFDASSLLPVTAVYFRDYCIYEIDSWWSRFGQKLTHITLFRCQLDMTVLFTMLRQAPNLRSLHLWGMWLIDSAELDFRLDRMEELSLNHIRHDGEGELVNLLDVVEEIFPRLKRLRIRSIVPQHPLNVDCLLRTIHALQDTLEGFELDDPVAVDVLRDLTQLRLKRVSIHVDPGFVCRPMNRFFKVQPLIEELIVYAKDLQNDHILCDIGRAVPKLKRLTVRNFDEITVDFLELMPNLELLSIYCVDFDTRFSMGKKGNPRLKELCVKNGTIDGFMKYLGSSPLIRSVVLSESCLEENKETPSEAVLNNHLKSLKVTDCGSVSPAMLEILYQQCPMIEHVFLGFDDRFNDEVVMMTCKHLKYLRNLTLEFCSVTDLCVKHKINHGHLLEELKISQYRISEEAIAELESTRNIRVINSNF